MIKYQDSLLQWLLRPITIESMQHLHNVSSRLMRPLPCSAERSILWEADDRSFGRDISRVNANPMVPCRIFKSSALYRTLIQANRNIHGVITFYLHQLAYYTAVYFWNKIICAFLICTQFILASYLFFMSYSPYLYMTKS